MKRLMLLLPLLLGAPQPTLLIEQRGEFMPVTVYVDGQRQGVVDRRKACIELRMVRPGTNIIMLRRVGFPDEGLMVVLGNAPGWHIELVWDMPARIMPMEKRC